MTLLSVGTNTGRQLVVLFGGRGLVGRPTGGRLVVLRITGAFVTTGGGVGGGRSVVVVTDRMTGGGASPHVLQQSRA